MEGVEAMSDHLTPLQEIQRKAADKRISRFIHEMDKQADAFMNIPVVVRDDMPPDKIYLLNGYSYQQSGKIGDIGAVTVTKISGWKRLTSWLKRELTRLRIQD